MGRTATYPSDKVVRHCLEPHLRMRDPPDRFNSGNMQMGSVPSFKKHYRTLFERLGYPLKERAGTPTKTIIDAENRLGVEIPRPLRDYYLVAGRERRFNQCLNRFLSPVDWLIDNKRLLFLEENQTVLWWGVSIRNPKTVDPPISQGINADPISWHSEHRKCSIFLTFMLHYHAANGGLPYSGRADAPDQTDYRFESNGWTNHGEVGCVRAYSREGQVVCLKPPGNLVFRTKWSIEAAAKTKTKLKAIGDELGVIFD